jgi:hypothetical protein
MRRAGRGAAYNAARLTSSPAAGAGRERAMTTSSNQPPKDLIGFLDYYLVTKAPVQLPEPAREFIVRFGPWIALVILILSLPPLLIALGLGALLTPFGGYYYTVGYGYLTIFVLVQVGLLVAALPGLFARKLSGWKLLFYSQLIGLVFSLLTGAIVSGLLGALIGLYILFQVRTKYTP